MRCAGWSSCSQLPNEIPSLPLLRTNPQIMDEIMDFPNASIYHHTFFQGSRMIKISVGMRTILSRGLASHQRTQRVLDKLCQVLHVFWQNGPTSFLAQQMRGTTGNRMGHTALHACRYTSVAAWLSKIRNFVELELAMSAIPQCRVIFLNISQRFRSAKPLPNSPAIDGRAASESQVW